MMDGEVVVSHPLEGVTQLTLNRPEKLNAMTSRLVESLVRSIDGVDGDATCRAVIITGAGRGFCAGLDLGGYGEVEGAAALGAVQRDFRLQRHIAQLVPRMRSLRVPVIAAVNGAATGGGLALVLASDVRIASRSARFSAAFVKIGLSGCDIGVSWLLPRAVGTSAAFELMLTGRIIDAGEAHAIKLVSSVVADDALLPAAHDLASMIIHNSPFGVEMTKEVMWSQLEVGSLQAGIDLENRTQSLAARTADHVEAVDAFVERRDPVYING